MDIADRAADESEALLAEQIRMAGRPVPGIMPTGHCHYCGEETNTLFCCADCREDYEAEQAQLKRLGRQHR